MMDRIRACRAATRTLLQNQALGIDPDVEREGERARTRERERRLLLTSSVALREREKERERERERERVCPRARACLRTHERASGTNAGKQTGRTPSSETTKP